MENTKNSPTGSTPTPPPALPALADTKDQTVTTRHKARIGGKNLSYTATCGTWVLREETGKEAEHQSSKPKSAMFFTAYTLEGKGDAKTDPSKRPIMFCFNGGPGSASVWLHMGLIGPKRIAMNNEGDAGPPPYKLVDNEFSMLADTDLVFIDPVGTGYSRMIEGEKTSEFHEYQRDLDSVGEFIRLYTSRNARWASPKFIAGESYGTTRACGLAGLLQDKYGMYLNGLVLISIAMDFQALRFDAGNEVPYVLYLPTYAATAWYHKKLAPDLQKKSVETLIKEVETFASGEYAAALFQGDALPKKVADALAEKVARYTGLSVEYVKSTKLRVQIDRFCKELLRGEGKTVGRLDTRFTSRDRDSAGENNEFDPAHALIVGPFAGTLNDYVRRTLKFESDLDYRVLTGLYQTWGWKDFANRYVNVSETLRAAMNKNPHMKVLVANGYFDLATPHFAADYTFNHLMLDAPLHNNITTRYYPAGHMMYIHQPSLKKVAADINGFISKSK
ncbi:MAG: S10 family peptidase [Burkholderiales bacterium]|jgi:carboxypeptidase C (cathepsin A)